MRRLVTTFEVAADPGRVYDLIADPRRHAEWQTAVREVIAISGRGSGVGSSYSAVYRVAGQRLEARFVVTAADRPRVHQATGTSAAGRATWTTTLDGGPAAGSTGVSIALEYELAGNLVGGLLALFTGRRIALEFHRTYGRLRTLVEREAATAAPPESRVVSEPG